MWSKMFQSVLSIAFELTILFIGISILINLLQGFIPYKKMERLMEKSHPLVVNLLNKKVRFGIVMIFLFSSPVLDPTIITLMATVLGVIVAITYTIITSFLSIMIGFALAIRRISNSIVRGKGDIEINGALRDVN